MLLTKALKHAYKSIGSCQLVGQLLTVLAPVQVEKNDVPGAKRMLESAKDLLKNVSDWPSLLVALDGLHDLHEMEGSTEKASNIKTYLENKANDIKNRLKKATDSPDHAKVLEGAEWLRARASIRT